MYLDDETRLRHIRDAARDALDFVQGRTRADLDSDRMLRRAVLSCLADIGEAAWKLSEEARLGQPGVPWRQVIGMRHHIIHGYDRVNLDIVWKTVSEDLQPLLTTLEQRLGPAYNPEE